MKQAVLKTPQGEHLLTFDLPESLSEVSLVRYVSFLNEVRGRDWETELITADKMDRNPIVQMAKAVGEFCGAPIDTVLRAKLGDAYHSEHGLDNGIRSLYGWIIRAAGTYRGEARAETTHRMTYKEQEYEIPYIVSATLGGTPLLPNVETVEAIEAYETIRTFTETIKMTDDPDGNYAFARYLRMIAVLCRKPGERLPTEEGERERFIQGRMIEFQEIDAKTAIDVDFFLLNTYQASAEIPPLVGSLTLPLFALAAEIQSLNLKRMKEQSRTKKRSLLGLDGKPLFSNLSSKGGLKGGLA